MIKAIETEYNGYKFRSRLEARWAVFFDALGVKYEYEKEGYQLDSGWYLPDFWLPGLDFWLEIKGDEATIKEEYLAQELAAMTNKSVSILTGQIGLSAYDHGLTIYEGDGSMCDFFWAECSVCGQVGITYNSHLEHLKCDCFNSYRNYNENPYRLTKAFKAARQARFEHGEAPSTKPKWA
jgi:hypothetical protein